MLYLAIGINIFPKYHFQGKKFTVISLFPKHSFLLIKGGKKSSKFLLKQTYPFWPDLTLNSADAFEIVDLED